MPGKKEECKALILLTCSDSLTECLPTLKKSKNNIYPLTFAKIASLTF